MKKGLITLGCTTVLALTACGGDESNDDQQTSLAAETKTCDFNPQGIVSVVESSDNPFISVWFDTDTAEYGEDKLLLKAATMAHVYGYSPATVAQKQYNQTNPTSIERVYAPINQLFIPTSPPTPDEALWVSPNPDVMNSSAHLDLSEEPMIIYTPSIQDRYFSWQLMDAYTNSFAYIGTRATKSIEGAWAIVGPDYDVSLVPEEFDVIQAPTNNVWLVGRHELLGYDQDNIADVIGLLQDSILLPLQEYQDKDPEYVNPIISKDSLPVVEPLELVSSNFFGVGGGNGISGLDLSSSIPFFVGLNDWMTANPPPETDAEVLNILEKICVGPGFNEDFSDLSLEQEAILTEALVAGQTYIFKQMFVSNQFSQTHWFYSVSENMGNYGSAYTLRSGMTMIGLGANVREEAIYPATALDNLFIPLTGDNDYTITIPAEQLPVPVNGFWSITPYSLDCVGCLIENSIDRYSLGSKEVDDMKVNADGSLTIYLQNEQPDDELINNWLPTPSEMDSLDFYLLFRFYYPDPTVYTPSDDGGIFIPFQTEYPLPVVTRVTSEE